MISRTSEPEKKDPVGDPIFRIIKQSPRPIMRITRGTCINRHRFGERYDFMILKSKGDHQAQFADRHTDFTSCERLGAGPWSNQGVIHGIGKGVDGRRRFKVSTTSLNGGFLYVFQLLQV